MTTKNNFLAMLEEFSTRHADKSELTQRFISLLNNHDDETAFLRNCFDDGHFVWSVLVTNTDRSKLMLMHHKKFWTWQQFWGHADGEMDMLNVARRELEEEAGIVWGDVEILPIIFSLDVHGVPAHHNEPAHYHYDVTFLAVVDESIIVNKQEAEVLDIEWFDIDLLRAELHGGKFSSWLENNLNYL